VSALMPSWPPDSLSRFEFLPGGYSNLNFRFQQAGQDYVLRLPRSAHAFVDRELEQSFYQAAQGPAGVEVAQIVVLDIHSGELISRWLRGPLLADKPPAASELVHFLQHLHGRLPHCDRDYDPIRLANDYLQIGKPDRDIVRLAARLHWLPEESRPCHNDLNPWNVVIGDTGWVTLDWEWFGNNDPLFDLVTLHQGLGFEAESLLPLAQELTSRVQVEARITAALTAFWLREYAWAHAELAQGNKRAEIETQRDLARQRLRTL
jgi:thiamine kinase-like enzyme